METFREPFSISIFGRKHVCRLAYSINNQRNNVQLNLEKRTSSLPSLSRLAHIELRRFQRWLPFGAKTNTMCNLCWSVIAISTSLPRQLFSEAEKRLVFLHRQLSRFKWKFWRKKQEEFLTAGYVVFEKSCPWVRQSLQFVGNQNIVKPRLVLKCWNTLGRFQWSF